MGSVTILPRARALTVADLEQVPDDGHRYELVDGTLVVTPAPSVRHQDVSMRMAVLLFTARTPGLRVLAAPADVILGSDTALQPDLLVAREDDFTESSLPVAPLLVVEILSPSTRLVDLNLKKARYEAAGVASYWVIDPDVPRLIAWELSEGEYAEVADVSGQEQWTSERPYPVTVVPAQLVASVAEAGSSGVEAEHTPRGKLGDAVGGKYPEDYLEDLRRDWPE
jgi:Uma2 family endonuclease